MKYILFMLEKEKNGISDTYGPDIFEDSNFCFKNVSFCVKSGILTVQAEDAYTVNDNLGNYQYFPRKIEYIFPFLKGNAIELELYEVYCNNQKRHFTTLDVNLLRDCPYYKKIGIDRIEKKDPNSLYTYQYVHSFMDFYFKTDGEFEKIEKPTEEKYQYQYENRDAHVYYVYIVKNATWALEEVKVVDPPHLRRNEKVLYTKRDDVYNIIKEIISHY